MNDDPITRVSNAEIPTDPAPIHAIAIFDNLFPNKARVRKPMSGNMGMSAKYVVIVYSI
jgi:hypothetical protein